MTLLTPMTELDALNDMLSVIGESPVASLDEANSVPDAQIALSILRKSSRAVQEKGWGWNTEEGYRLAPDTDGNINLPPNTLEVDPSDPTLDYIERGGKLYDRTKQTFNIGAAVNVDIAFLYDFADLPSKARKYIAAVAGKIFQARMEGDPNISAEEDREVLAAWADLIQAECEDQEFNVMDMAPTVALRRRWRSR